MVLLVLCIALTRDLRRDPIWLRKQLSDSVMRRTVRAAVEEHGHQKFVLATKESTDPPTGQFQAVDATAARVMGINPHKIKYLSKADDWLGPIGEPYIRQTGEAIASVRTNFALLEKIPAHQGIRLVS